ncbi:uncharacterized protein LOC103573347 [Microplitis demolitor]|uniref:uncharacterized protein LOC103573347 n=1 Tax=Microplitis demolitor TaxID=69319 RepID=UPI0004CCB035|nr:uncharacterized protein LOC103573347 [Microplitis demolitor]
MEGDKCNKNNDNPKLQSVRRKLFADDNEDDSDEDNKTTQGNDDNLANRLIEETRFEARERWNFDFEKGEPLTGQWEWVKIDEEFSDRTPATALGNSHSENRDNLQEEKIDNNNH